MGPALKDLQSTFPTPVNTQLPLAASKVQSERVSAFAFHLETAGTLGHSSTLSALASAQHPAPSVFLHQEELLCPCLCRLRVPQALSGKGELPEEAVKRVRSALDFLMRNALLNQNAVENEAWGMRRSDRLREKPAAASLT